MREFHRKGQPHFQQHRTPLNLTLLVYDAVPRPRYDALRLELADRLQVIEGDAPPDRPLRRAQAHADFEAKLEALLAADHAQEHPFRQPLAAQTAADYLRKFDGEFYRLHAFSVMSNHLHVLFDLEPQLLDADEPRIPLEKIIGRMKGGSAFAVNRALGRSGPLWRKGYYDRYIRGPRHFARAYEYNLQNPVKAGLVARWEDHPYTWGRELDGE